MATIGWNKLTASKLSVNVKIVEWVRKLLSTIPYEENCLRSFPNKQAMIREINEESLHLLKPAEKDTQGFIHQSDVKQLEIPNSQLKPIPLYHAKSQSPSAILQELVQFRTNNYQKHKKGAILCAVGIPLTLPFALVPVVPNVPGFYLAYRLYCHVKALMGIHNLDYLLKETHLRFTALPQIDEAYKDTKEKLLISEEVITTLVDELSLPIKDDLTKAMIQTRRRLEGK